MTSYIVFLRLSRNIIVEKQHVIEIKPRYKVNNYSMNFCIDILY